MRLPENGNDLLTVAAVGVLAMCVVTFDHEVLGHGSVCVLLPGRILLLSFPGVVSGGWPLGRFGVHCRESSSYCTNTKVGRLQLV